MSIPPLRKPSSLLGEAYARFRLQVLQTAPAMHFVSIDILDELDRLAPKHPDKPFAVQRCQLADLLKDPALSTDQEKREQFKQVYTQAELAVYPATCAYLQQCHALGGLTQSSSLFAVDLDTLRRIDVLAHSDEILAKFVRQMTAKLAEVKSVPDVQRYGQFFEIYGEAIVLLELRARGIKVRRVPEGSKSMPDFECETEEGKIFYVEVKTFDIVSGVHRHNELLSDALDSEISIEQQIAAGKTVAMAEREVGPYQKAGSDPSYDARSLIRVIDTLREKWRGTFKASQFKQGPTFALALLDRLILPGGANDIAPYFYDDLEGGACISGVIWHSAFGQVGTPILRYADFAGAPTFEGYLTKPGVYVDTTASFEAAGIIVLDVHQSQRVSYGLASPHEIGDGWLSDDTEEVLRRLCNYWNDQENSQSFSLSKKIL